MSLHSALQLKFERLPVGGKYLFIFGSSPAVTGRDWQEGNNVRLSGNIGKGVITGNTMLWRSLPLLAGWCAQRTTSAAKTSAALPRF
jgi:hypothetical protein